MIRKTITLSLPRPLTRRACAELTNLTNRFRCHIMLENNNRSVNGKSMLGLLTLMLSENRQVTVEADGEDEKEAVDAIIAFRTAM